MEFLLENGANREILDGYGLTVEDVIDEYIFDTGYATYQYDGIFYLLSIEAVTDKRPDSKESNPSNKGTEKDKEEGSSGSGDDKKVEGPSDAGVGSNTYSDDNKKENDAPLELKPLETNTQIMQKKLEEALPSEKTRKEKEKIERELEERQTVKGHNILEETDEDKEEDVGNDNGPNSKHFMPEVSNSNPRPQIPEEGPVKCPTKIIADPSFLDSSVISFAITCGLLAFPHLEKHLHGDILVTEAPDLII